MPYQKRRKGDERKLHPKWLKGLVTGVIITSCIWYIVTKAYVTYYSIGY